VGNPRVLRGLPRRLSPEVRPAKAGRPQRPPWRGGPSPKARPPDATRPPDAAAMERAVAVFLEAAGLDMASDPNLARTPRRVAEAWMNDFLDGYRTTPEEALGKRYPVPPAPPGVGELVVVTDLRFHSMCPHHLLPYQGRAHLAYVPSGGVVGFGRLAALLDCFAHRLILQEALAREVAQALVQALGSPGAACVLEAEQFCLRIRGGTRCDAVTHSEAYEGALRDDPELRRELWARIQRPARRARGGKR